MKARFSRKAQNYDNSSQIQKESADLLLESIKNYKADIVSAADLGSGTGYLPQILIRSYSNIKIDCCDISKEMLAVLKNNQDLQSDISTHLCSNPPESNYDLICSNFSLQWFDDIQATLRDCQNKLNKGGILALSIPVKGTFNHLEKAILDSGVNIQIPQLPKAETIISFLTTKNIVKEQTFELYETFPNSLEFLRGLHKIGATKEGPVNPAKELRKLIACHDKLFEGPVRAKYKVLQVILKNA